MADAYTYRAVYDHIINRAGIVGVTTVPTTPPTGFEGTNAFDFNRQSLWKIPTTGAPASFSITLQLATGINPNVISNTAYTFGIGFANHNFGTAGVTAFAYEVANSSGGPWTNFMSNSAAYALYTQPDSMASGATTSVGTFTFHRLTFTWPTPIVDATIGGIYIGVFLEWPVQPDTPSRRTLICPSTPLDTEAGERFVQGRNAQAESSTLDVRGLTRTQMASMRRMFQRQRGGTYPFMLYTHDMPNLSSSHDWATSVGSPTGSNTQSGYGGATWVHFDQQELEYTETFSGYHDITMALRRTMSLDDSV